jgi:FkbM family methyltransferase
VEHTYGGVRLSVALEDPLAEGWYDRDWPSVPEVSALTASRLKSGAQVFDLGAHQGIVAMMLAHVVGQDGSVVAVEAERHNYEVALRNMELNDLEQVHMVHAAAAAKQGRIGFADGLNGHVVARGRLGSSRVRSVTIDGLAVEYGRPDVVLIDVEGYEAEVLRGAEKCLDLRNTDFFIEVHGGEGLEELGGSPGDVIGHFPSHRFRRFWSPGGGTWSNYDFVELDEARIPHGRFLFVAVPS